MLILAHDATNLTRLCDVIYAMERGRIVAAREPGGDAAAAPPLKIPVRLEGEVALITPSDILFAAAAEGRSLLRTTTGELPTQFTLGELEERLSNRGFFRAHRSYLVNLQHVKSVIPYTRNAFSLILDDADETEIPLSKSSAAELRELLGTSSSGQALAFSPSPVATGNRAQLGNMGKRAVGAILGAARLRVHVV